MNYRYFPAVLIFTLPLVAAQSVQYVIVGQTGSLNPEIKTSDGAAILWKHNGDKVVEFNGNEEIVYNPYKDRITLDWHTADLEITGLTYEDSGDYELEVFVNKKLDRSNFELKVIDKVSKPTISCEIVKEGTNSGESGKRAILKCSAESRRSESLTKIEWSSHGNIVPGPNLTIFLGDQHDDEEYNCTVSNPLSGETETFTARDCYPEINSAAIIVGVCVLIAILLIVGLLVFWKLRKKYGPEEKRSNTDEETVNDGQSCPPPQTQGSRLGVVKKLIDNYESNKGAKNMSPRKPIRSFDQEESREKEEDSGYPEEQPLIGGQSSCPPPQTPGLVPKTDDTESEQKSAEKIQGNPEEEPFIDRQSTFRSPQRLASLAPKNDDAESDQNVPEEEGGNAEDQPVIGGQSSCPPPQTPGSALKPDDTESDENFTGGVKKLIDNYESNIGAKNMTPRKPIRSFDQDESNEKEEESGYPEEQPLIGGQSSCPPPQTPGLVPKTDDTESEQKSADAEIIRPKKPRRSFYHDESSGKESRKETDDDNEINSFPAHPYIVCTPPSPLNSSNTPHEGKIIEHQEEANSGQVSGEKVTSGESGLEEGKESDDDPLEKDNTRDSHSENSFKDTSEEVDQVTDKTIFREADSNAKDSEEVLAADEAARTAKKASTEEQTSEQVEKESHLSKVSQQEDKQSHEDDQKDNNQRSESPKSPKQENHDSVSPNSAMAAAPSQGDQSRHSSSDEEETESESKNEQPKDNSEHEDKPNSDQVGGKSDSDTDEKKQFNHSTEDSPTPEHKAQEIGTDKERDTT